MKNILVLAAIGAVVWFWNKESPNVNAFISGSPQTLVQTNIQPEPTTFRCEGKTGCHQMSSCAEAKFYIQNCPDTRMDGDRDGIPCERTLCH